VNATIIVVAGILGVLIVAGLALVVGLSALSYRETRELGKAMRERSQREPCSEIRKEDEA